MTQAEAMELIAIWSGLASTDFALYITATFAYIVAAYVVGSKLTRIQTLMISFLYVWLAVIAVLAVDSDFTWMQISIEQLVDKRLQGITYTGEFWRLPVTGFMICGILVSIYFMWNVRHPKTT
jgi:magnesium-transporting ATPase (P-type)